MTHGPQNYLYITGGSLDDGSWSSLKHNFLNPVDARVKDYVPHFIQDSYGLDVIVHGCFMTLDSERNQNPTYLLPRHILVQDKETKTRHILHTRHQARNLNTDSTESLSEEAYATADRIYEHYKQAGLQVQRLQQTSSGLFVPQITDPINDALSGNAYLTNYREGQWTDLNTLDCHALGQLLGTMSAVGENIVKNDTALFDASREYTDKTALKFWLEGEQSSKDEVLSTIAHQGCDNMVQILYEWEDFHALQENRPSSGRTINMFNPQNKSILTAHNGEFALTSMASAPRGCLPNMTESGVTYDAGQAAFRMVVNTDISSGFTQRLENFTQGFAETSGKNVTVPDMCVGMLRANASECLIISGALYDLGERNIIQIPSTGFVKSKSIISNYIEDITQTVLESNATPSPHHS